MDDMPPLFPLEAEPTPSKTKIVEKSVKSKTDYSNNWTAVVGVLLDGEKRYKSKGLPTKEEAQAALRELVAKVESGEMEAELQRDDGDNELDHPIPDIDPDIELVNDNTPRISRMQIDLLVNAMANDMTRIGSLQYMRSVGQARMNWLGIKEGHHGLSHEPDTNKEAAEKLTKINEWFAAELAYLTKRLAETPEPGANGSMLDNTLIVWLNELGIGNRHTLTDIPFVLIGGKAHGIKTGRHLKFQDATHNRLWLTIAQSMGHDIQTFGNANLCEGGALNLS